MSAPAFVQHFTRTYSKPMHFLGNTLLEIAEDNEFPGYDEAPTFNNHNGFSNCIFVTASYLPDRIFLAGSTVLYLGWFNDIILTQRFQALRHLRFKQNPFQYDNELRLRFRNPDDNSTPDRRYQACGWNRHHSGPILARYASKVGSRLRFEYAQGGTRYTGDNWLAALDQRKYWVPFSYNMDYSQSYFAVKVHSNQQNLFEPVARCLKCRVIHEYEVPDENLEGQATANKSCQCGEDIVYGKLRSLNRVGYVVLEDIAPH